MNIEVTLTQADIDNSKVGRAGTHPVRTAIMQAINDNDDLRDYPFDVHILGDSILLRFQTDDAPYFMNLNQFSWPFEISEFRNTIYIIKNTYPILTEPKTFELMFSHRRTYAKKVDIYYEKCLEGKQDIIEMY